MNKYNPNIHHRRSIRLKGYDYSQAGAYFITICCQDKICRFGEVVGNEMILNELGQIAYDEWVNLSERFENFELDVFQIMPNHMHGIIVLNNPVGATHAVAPQSSVSDACENVEFQDRATARVADVKEKDDCNGEAYKRATARVAGVRGIDDYNGESSNKRATARVARTAGQASISDIVGAYKSLVANACLNIFKAKNEIMGKLWQRNYYEIIIRDEQSYQRISNYIINNPVKWRGDKFHAK